MVWPVVAPRLTSALLARGVNRATTEDIVQEVASRVLVKSPSFSSADDLYRWARRVGINLSIADYRRSTRIVFAVPTERADHTDVHLAVEDRLAWERLLEGLVTLSESEREVLLYEILGRPDWTVATTRVAKVRRHRARRRLEEALRAIGDGAAAIVGLHRRWWRAFDPVMSSPAALAAVAWLLPTAASLLGLSPAGDPPVAPGAAGARRIELAVAQRPVPEATASPAPSRSESEDRRRTGASPTASPPPTPPSTVLRLPGEAHGVADGGVTRRDEDTLRVCVQGNPVLSDGCVVSANPFEHLPRRPR